jgi:hypothetical protein
VVGDVVPLTQSVLNGVERFAPNPNSCPMIGVCQLSRAFMAVLRPGKSPDSGTAKAAPAAHPPLCPAHAPAL